MICEVYQLGRVSYQQALDLQNELVQERSRGAPDRLLLLEHPPTYTLGAAGDETNLLLSSEQLDELGVEVFRTDRGGDITYHGPGQLVGYPIIALPRVEAAGLRADFIGYIRDLEQVMIRLLADYGVAGKPIPGLTGVWVDTPQGEAKICAIGVKINVRVVTKHGFALNLNTDLRYFDGIIPCGIKDKSVTSLAALLGHPVDADEVIEHLLYHFGEVFGFEMLIVQNSPS
jgi:lipoyl(octanoyl) transferase